MRSRVLYVLSTAAVVLVVMYAGLAWWSHQPRHMPAGVADGRLAPCGTAPNCVVSEAGADEAHAVAPLTAASGPAWDAAVAAVKASGGRIETNDGTYLHATFVSRIFRYVDDLELRADGDAVQVRSASRVGYSDLGVNRKRVEALRAALSGQKR